MFWKRYLPLRLFGKNFMYVSHFLVRATCPTCHSHLHYSISANMNNALEHWFREADGCLFEDITSIAYVTYRRMRELLWIKYCQEHDSFRGTILAFVWKDWGKPTNLSWGIGFPGIDSNLRSLGSEPVWSSFGRKCVVTISAAYHSFVYWICKLKSDVCKHLSVPLTQDSHFLFWT